MMELTSSIVMTSRGRLTPMKEVEAVIVLILMAWFWLEVRGKTGEIGRAHV